MHYRVLTIFGKYVVVFIFKKSLIISLSSNEEDPENQTNEELLAEIDPIFEKFEGIIDACECQAQKQQQEPLQ